MYIILSMPPDAFCVKKNQILLNIIAFLTAFCSLSYEILIAARLSRLWGEGMFLYPACIAVFIFFMGLGSAVWYRKSPDIEGQSIKKLLAIEMILTATGYLSVLSINLCLYGALYSINMAAFFVGIILAAIIGFLSGQELPLIFHFCAYLKMEQRQIRRIIFYDYAASFFASVMCTLVFFATLGFLKTSVLVAFVNLLVVFLILAACKMNAIARAGRRGVHLLTALFLGIFIVTAARLDKMENFIIRQTYLGCRNAVLLEKRYTPYQQVLLFAMRKDYEPINHAKKEILTNPEQYYLFAVLNGSLQFFEPFEIGADPDHTFLFDPYLRLVPGIEDVLILGGGDGLPARQAVTYPSIKQITMVDIDKEWVEFAMTNPFMKQKNRGALSDPRLEIHYMDAFEWVLRTKKRYDMIVVDFPSEPSSLAKIRTTSVQFFRDLARILNGNGVVVLHSNHWSSILKRGLFSKTARMAGLYPLFGYKEDSRTWSAVEQIVLFKSDQARGAYIDGYNNVYLRSGEFKETRKRFGYLTYEEAGEARDWISFYDPLVSRLPFRKKVELIKEDSL